MPATRADGDRLFATTWVHLFEEDTALGAVYCPEDDAVPLSRRPRERLALAPDGSARVFVPGPDDRPVEQPATWAHEGDALVVRTPAGGAHLRIVHQSTSRLVIQTQKG